MGGKKKKSAAGVAAPLAPAAAASAGRSEATAAEKQGASNKPAKPIKENKSKAPKTYSLANTAQVDTGGVADKSILKVVIQPDLEKKIIKLINDFREENGDKGPMQEESQKSSRPKFQPPAPEISAPPSPKAPSIAPRETPKASEKDEAACMKDWILRYAEQSSEEEEEEEEEAGKKPRNPELEEKFDPNDRYLLLTAQLYDARDMAAVAKTKGDKTSQRSAQDRIRIILQGGGRAAEGKENTSCHRGSRLQPPVVKKNEPKDIRDFDYTARSWTGKSPKQFLIDWSGRTSPRARHPPSTRCLLGNTGGPSEVRVQRTEDILEVCPTILTEDSMQAQHLAATLALYTMVKGQVIHRDVWLEWRDSEQQKQEESRTAANKPRDQFISRLLTRLKQQQNQDQGPEAGSEGPSGGGAGEEEPEESWENLAGLDMEEGGGGGGGRGEVEDKSEKRGRKEGALEAARELLMKLRKEQLPVFQHRHRVLEALQRHPVVVVAGETGSGKSTQIPQFLLEELLIGCPAARPVNIVVTQPRRISAMSLACRVGGGDPPPVLHHRGPAEETAARLTPSYIKTLFHFLNYNSLVQPVPPKVHERSVQSDFLLTILKDVVMKRSDLKLILMSATVDCQKFSSYFNRCPVSHLEDIVEETGYLLEKDSEYTQKILEDEEEVNISFSQKGGKTSQHQVLQYMNPNKINMDLLQLFDLLTSDKRFRDKNRFKIVALHSTLSSKDQAAAFTVPPAGVRKIVLSTNIAETGVTIPDVVFVIDTGKTKENNQRPPEAGPSGTRPQRILLQTLPQVQPQSVCNAVSLLRKIGACHPEKHILTPLGHHLACLPVNKSPFSTPMNRKEEANLAKAALAVSNSDHLTIYNAYLGWKTSQSDGQRAETSYCRKHFLNRTALITIEGVQQELMRMMEQVGFYSLAPDCRLQRSLSLRSRVARVLVIPSVDVLERAVCNTETPQGRAQVHPSSVNRNLQTHGWLLYQEKVKYTKIYLRDTTLIPPFPLLLFGGDIDIQHRERLITLDGWIHFQAPVRIGVIFKHLRKLMDSLLEKKLENPRMNLEADMLLSHLRGNEMKKADDPFSRFVNFFFFFIEITKEEVMNLCNVHVHHEAAALHRKFRVWPHLVAGHTLLGEQVQLLPASSAFCFACCAFEKSWKEMT
ncbi:hypothetical protein F7725_015159 [Dissostichus mawsoni]|uniref:RNA helicase n=1 Tax=Dissostichus mawsoni TaxID=36200 RepID=A0A7J5YGN1_DISMA|nr:hypothetical protein F7725_015159 [Dissostichus mawsoni]